MNLYSRLREREESGRPLRVGLIGAGKFGSMYLAQVPRTPGIHLVAIADLSPANAHKNLQRVGWAPERVEAATISDAAMTGRTHVGDDWRALVTHHAIDIVIECTGNPAAAVDHALTAFEHGKHVVNVTVEADAFCGPFLARAAQNANVIYSLAYGDQPALACELVDWARASGFPVVAAGRGHKWLPRYRQSTPETVWDHWGLTAEQAERGGLNAKMFNGFLDGSKPAIETAALANAIGLEAPDDGLSFSPGSIDDIPNLMRPKSEGGILERKGLVECVSSLRHDGTPIPYDIRKGVWVCIEASTDYIRNCFEEYKVTTDDSGRYMTMYRRWHMIGLELGISVASVGIRREPTGVAACFNADVVATAKRDLAAGEVLDGEGGYTVFGKLTPARRSLEIGALPLGLAHHVKLLKPILQDAPVSFADVEIDRNVPAYKARKAMEEAFSVQPAVRRLAPAAADR